MQSTTFSPVFRSGLEISFYMDLLVRVVAESAVSGTLRRGKQKIIYPSNTQKLADLYEDACPWVPITCFQVFLAQPETSIYVRQMPFGTRNQVNG
jgi:hypothetical protein